MYTIPIMSQTTIVKYQNLELACKVNTVSKYRSGKLPLDKVLLSDEIFKTVKNGKRANATDLENAFGTKNVLECINIMLQKGNYQISAEERKEKVAEKKREIIGYIHRNYIDPKMKTTIPITRIECALESIKAKFDPDIPVDKQLQPILKKLPCVMPMKRQEGQNGVLKIPHQYIGNARNVILKYAGINSERYDTKGCIYEITFSQSQYDDLMQAVNKFTYGQCTFELIT